jgi:hypothetical protein
MIPGLLLLDLGEPPQIFMWDFTISAFALFLPENQKHNRKKKSPEWG